MPNLRVIHGGRDVAESDFENFEGSDNVEFGAPPNLYIGLATGLVGAAAGILSIGIYFLIWDPEPYVSPVWLRFVFLGAVAGFFMRMEKIFLRCLADQDD